MHFSSVEITYYPTLHKDTIVVHYTHIHMIDYENVLCLMAYDKNDYDIYSGRIVAGSILTYKILTDTVKIK